jgi:hypothetical protein
MPKGLWVWPSDPKAQKRVLRNVAASPHLMAAITAIGKSKEGMSNAELVDAVNDVSEWTTLWSVRQLTALGFLEFKVDFFGNPAKYQLSESGRAALSTITGQPLPKPPTPAAPAVPPAQPAVPKAAAPAPQPAPQPAPPKAS